VVYPFFIILAETKNDYMLNTETKSAVLGLSAEEIIEYASQFNLSKRKRILEHGMIEVEAFSDDYKALEDEWEKVSNYLADRHL